MKIFDLYEELSIIYGKTVSNIERTIRYSISQYKLSNKEFIVKAVDEMLNASGVENRRFLRAEEIEEAQK